MPERQAKRAERPVKPSREDSAALGPIEAVDLAIADALDAHDEAPVKALGSASEIADQPPLAAITLAVLAAGLVLRDRKLARAGARMVASHTLATAIKTRAKHRIDRTRPDHAIEKGRHEMKRGGHRTHALSSFPSGHTASATAVAHALGRDYPRAGLAASAGAAAVALIQLPRAKHYASDLAAGYVIGRIAEWVIARAIPAASRRGAMIK